MKLEVAVAYSVLLLRDFDSPEPNDRCDVNDNSWPGVLVVRHGDELMKSDNSRSAQRKHSIYLISST